MTQQIYVLLYQTSDYYENGFPEVVATSPDFMQLDRKKESLLARSRELSAAHVRQAQERAEVQAQNEIRIKRYLEANRQAIRDPNCYGDHKANKEWHYSDGRPFHKDYVEAVQDRVISNIAGRCDQLFDGKDNKELTVLLHLNRLNGPPPALDPLPPFFETKEKVYRTDKDFFQIKKAEWLEAQTTALNPEMFINWMAEILIERGFVGTGQEALNKAAGFFEIETSDGQFGRARTFGKGVWDRDFAHKLVEDGLQREQWWEEES